MPPRVSKTIEDVDPTGRSGEQLFVNWWSWMNDIIGGVAILANKTLALRTSCWIGITNFNVLVGCGKRAIVDLVPRERRNMQINLLEKYTETTSSDTITDLYRTSNCIEKYQQGHTYSADARLSRSSPDQPQCFLDFIHLDRKLSCH